MIPLNRKNLYVVILITLVGVGFSACQRILPADQFVVEYEKQGRAERTVGSLLFQSLLQSEEYLQAKSQMLGVKTSYSATQKKQSIYVRVSFRKNMQTSSVNASVANFGPLDIIAINAETLKKLQTGLSPFIRLIDDKGISVAPLLYHFERGYPPNAIHSFQFVFPDNDRGVYLNKNHLEIILSEFGLTTGEVRMTCKIPEYLKLKPTEQVKPPKQSKVPL